jgi:hypothetical protein
MFFRKQKQERDSGGKFIKGHVFAGNHHIRADRSRIKGETIEQDPLIHDKLLTQLTQEKSIISIFGVGDLHYLNPVLQEKAQKMINIIPTLRYLEEQPAIDIFAFGGDVWDLDFLAHWNSDNFENIGYDTIAKLIQQEAADVHELLKKFIKAARPKIIYYFIGNHEGWVEAFQRKHQKAFRQPIGELLKLKKLGIIEVPQYGSIHIGHLTLTHGEQYRGENPPKNAIMKSHRSVFMFHHHKYIVWPGYSDMDALDKLQAYCLPGMCNVCSMEWMKKAPNNWSCGFFKVYMKASGKFTPTVQVISPSGNFIVNGIEYE